MAPMALAIGIAGPFGPKNRNATLVENRYETSARIPDNFEIRPQEIEFPAMIEFQCTHCDKALKTSGDKAGRQAKCPGCGGLIAIPPLSGPSELDSDLTNSGATQADFIPSDALPEENEKTCSSCGDVLGESAIRCHRCGKVFQPNRFGSGRLRGNREIRPFPPGEVIADAWRIYTEKLGLLVGSFLITYVLSGIVHVIGWMPMALAGILFDQDDELGGIVAGVAGIICMLAASSFSVYLILRLPDPAIEGGA